MKIYKSLPWLKSFTLLLITTVTTTVWAMGDTPKSEKVSAIKSSVTNNYYWYDGNRKRTISQDKSVVAELITPGTKSVLQKKLATAKSTGKQTSATVKLWDVSAAGNAKQTLSTLDTAMNGKLSPVFTSGKSGAGKRMALPGGILVTFKSDWDDKKVQEWASNKRLTVKQKMNFGNIYVFNSKPGIASLNLANSIYESGEVKAASPNWWQDLHHF